MTPTKFEAINTMVSAICEIHVRGCKYLCFYRYVEIGGKMDMNADLQLLRAWKAVFTCVIQKVSMLYNFF